MAISFSLFCGSCEKGMSRYMAYIAQKNRIQIKEISRKDYNQKLGALAGIQGFAKEKVIYNGPDFPLEMIVFSGIDSAQIDSFLADYKQTGAQPVPLKAIITPQNIFWTVEALFKELWKEHLHFLPE